jgi:SAM-dependent methyltransferase
MSEPGFKDHFSSVAGAYASWRPSYPAVLFDTLAARVDAQGKVWEAGCGSGQATRDLARRFAHVFATDPSAQQVECHWAQQEPVTNVEVAVEAAEATSLGEASVDAVVVAQALHWFDRDRFFAECDRVLRPGGVLAAWAYQDMVFSDDLAPAADAFRRTIEDHWPPERAEVDAGYAHYHWPFEKLPAPQPWLTAEWSLPQLLGYLGSLSASARCRSATGVDPVALHATELQTAWGEPTRTRTMRWPLVMHLRRKPAAPP